MGKFQRDHTGTDGKKNRGQDIDLKECSKCYHNRMWVSRGGMDPQYSWKCTRCGYKISLR